MTKDIVCGKTVSEGTDLKTTYGERSYSFCSDTCERAFITNPTHYVDKSGSVGSTEGSPMINERGEKVRSRV